MDLISCDWPRQVTPDVQGRESVWQVTSRCIRQRVTHASKHLMCDLLQWNSLSSMQTIGCDWLTDWHTLYGCTLWLATVVITDMRSRVILLLTLCNYYCYSGRENVFIINQASDCFVCNKAFSISQCMYCVLINVMLCRLCISSICHEILLCGCNVLKCN